MNLAFNLNRVICCAVLLFKYNLVYISKKSLSSFFCLLPKISESKWMSERVKSPKGHLPVIVFVNDFLSFFLEYLAKLWI